MIQRTVKCLIEYRSHDKVGQKEEVVIAIGNDHGVSSEDEIEQGIFKYAKDDAEFRNWFTYRNSNDFVILRTLEDDPMVYSWWRLGCSAPLRKSELKRLAEGDSELLAYLVASGRFMLDGESYIPDNGDCIDPEIAQSVQTDGMGEISLDV